MFKAKSMNMCSLNETFLNSRIKVDKGYIHSYFLALSNFTWIKSLLQSKTKTYQFVIT